VLQMSEVRWASLRKTALISQSETGHLQSLNELARNARADFIIHTGDFGFYDERSMDRIAEK